MFTDICDIRTWVEALLCWAEDHMLDVNWFTGSHLEVVLPKGRLYINMTGPNWRISTLEKESLDHHIVIDEGPDHRVRVRRGPVGKLKETQYSPGVEDNRKLVDAARDIARLSAGAPREDFLDRFVRESAK